jgi:hypothetical protein
MRHYFYALVALLMLGGTAFAQAGGAGAGAGAAGGAGAGAGGAGGGQTPTNKGIPGNTTPGSNMATQAEIGTPAAPTNSDVNPGTSTSGAGVANTR